MNAVTAPSLLVRADASAAIGLGHAMRCFALAEAWIESGGRVTFAMREVPAVLRERFERAGIEVVPVDTAKDAAELVKSRGARVAVVDGYRLGVEDHRALADAGAKVLVVDDAGESATRIASWILNQNAYATPALYAGLGASPKLLLGTPYTLLRSEFRASRPTRETPERATRILVSFGGADVANLAPRAVEALAPLEGLDVLVLAGSANPRASELRAPNGARATIRVVPSVDDVAARLAETDLALVAAGSTSWELAACGVPAIVVVTAENQRGVGASVEELGLGHSLGDASTVTVDAMRTAVLHLVEDHDARARMAKRGPEIIDGKGALRVCAALREDEGGGAR